MDKKISEIKNELSVTGFEGLSGFIKTYSSDPRPGVKALVVRAE